MNRALAAITGASSGLGAVFARRLSATHDLLLIARRRERLESLADELRRNSGAQVEVYVADLADDAQRALLGERLRTAPTLELLVNNAGIGSRGALWDSPLEEQLRMHQINVLAVLQLTHAALANMVVKGSGAIINVASVAGFVRRPGSAGYGSTKAWVLAFSEAVHLDLRRAGANVRVQALCPGFTYTEFHDVMKLDRSRVAPPSLWLDPEFVVQKSLQGLSQDRLFVTPGWRYQLIVNFISIIPMRMRVMIEQWLSRKIQ